MSLAFILTSNLNPEKMPPLRSEGGALEIGKQCLISSRICAIAPSNHFVCHSLDGPAVIKDFVPENSQSTIGLVARIVAKCLFIFRTDESRAHLEDLRLDFVCVTAPQNQSRFERISMDAKSLSGSCESSRSKPTTPGSFVELPLPSWAEIALCETNARLIDGTGIGFGP